MNCKHFLIFLKDTNWRVGDGIGGSERRIGKVSSKAHCYALCSKTKKKGRYANGATVDVKTNTDCYCEFGMKDRDNDQKWISSFIERSKFIQIKMLHIFHDENKIIGEYTQKYCMEEYVT